METLISHKNAHNFCRVCLTQAKALVHLNNVVETTSNQSIKTLNDLLEFVTHTKINLAFNLPSSICQMCLSLLKLSYQFQTQYTESQSKLESVIGKTINEEPISLENNASLVEKSSKSVQVESTTKAPVELIFGENRIDLKNILVVEEELKEVCTYDGFLRNLGTEISAKFVKENKNKCKSRSDKDTQDVVVIEKINNTKFTSANIGELIDLENVNLENENTVNVTTVYICDTCKSLYETEIEFKDHLVTCQYFQTAPFQIVCDKCGHISLSQQQAYRHKVKHGGKMYNCLQCPKSYYTSSHLKVHMRTHSNKRNYLCNVCAKSFHYAHALEYHMRLHSGEKKYVCNYCGLRYTMPQTLKRHLRTHTHDKPYICMYCDKRFSSRGEKLCHEKVHTGEKNYFCEYCGKGFIKSGNRNLHYLSHTGSHECHLCSKNFAAEKFLKIHLKRNHGLEDSRNLFSVDIF